LSLRSDLNSSYMSSALRSVLRVICCDMKRTSASPHGGLLHRLSNRPAQLEPNTTAGQLVDCRQHCCQGSGRQATADDTSGTKAGFVPSACPLGHLAQGLPPIRLITSSLVRPCCMHHVSSRLLSTGSGRSRDASTASSLYPRRFSSSTTCCLLTDCGMTITKPLCQQVTRQICVRVCARDLTRRDERGRRLRPIRTLGTLLGGSWCRAAARSWRTRAHPAGLNWRYTASS